MKLPENEKTGTLPDGPGRAPKRVASDAGTAKAAAVSHLQQRGAEEALRQSEERYRSLIAKLQVAVVVHAPDSRILTVNPVAETLLGLSEGELAGKIAADPVWHFFREDGSVMPSQEYPINQVLATGQPVRNLVIGVHRPSPQEDVWVMVNANPVFTEDHEISEVVITFIDITERREAQEKLNYLAAIVESSDDAIIGKTLDEKISSWNAGAERVYGYTAEEVIGLPLSILIPPNLEDELATIMTAISHGEGVKHLETVRLRKGGEPINVALTISPIRNPRRRIVGASIIARDITERKRAEKERLSTLHFFEGMDRINRAIQGAEDPAQMINDVLDAALAVFACDRTWLLYPFEQETNTLCVPMERTRPEYPGALASGIALPMDRELALRLKDHPRPIRFGPDSECPLPKAAAEVFQVQSMMAMLIQPKGDRPYLFGLHQCSHPRIWTRDDERLFQEIARRLTDALSSFLAHQALKQSEIKYRRIVDTASEGIWGLSPDNRTVFINARMAEMLGYTCQEMSGRPASDFLFPEDVPAHLERIESARQGRSDTYERRFRRKDGSALWTLASAAPISDSENRFQGCFAMFTDITQRKRLQAREAMRANVLEKLIRGDTLAAILESLVQGIEAELQHVLGSIVLLDKTRRHLLHGAGPSLPQFYNEAVHGVEIGPEVGSCGAAAYTGQTVIVEDIQTHPYWSPYRKIAAQAGLASSWSQPIVNRQGEVIGTFAIYHRIPSAPTPEDLDLIQSVASLAGVVIEHKQGEEEIRELNTQLEQRVQERTLELSKSEERMRFFFERQVVGMAITSPEKGWLQVNDKLCEMLGYSREELIGKTWSELTYPDDLAADVTQFERLLKGEIESYTLEKRFVRKDSKLVFTNLSVGCVRHYGSSVDYVLALLEDITQRKQAERNAEEALQKELVLRKEMHHRVKNNLQVISSLLYLQSIKITDANSLALLRESQVRVRSIALVHEMLYQREDLTKICFHDYVRQLVSDLFAAYRVTQESVALKLGSAGVFLGLNTAIPCGIIITELITNALKYAFPDGANGEIEIALRPVGKAGLLSLTVRDNGIGLPADLDLEHPETMGLSLVRDLTRQLGGNLTFRVPASGAGSEVEITFQNQP